MQKLIERATSENNTSEDWDTIIAICEQADTSPSKAKEAVLALSKRLTHKNINVVLFSLTVANALVQNCNLTVRQEISSRAFLQAVLKCVNSPSAHQLVRNRGLDMIQTWANAFKGESSLDYMQEIYNQLRYEGAQFPTSAIPPSIKKKTSMTAKQKEEEELQLALALSLSDQQVVKREENAKQVRAMYDFNPTEAGELRLVKGSIVDVYDTTTFPDWWKGSFKGEVGIFPANYVEKISNGSHINEGEDILNQLQAILLLKEKILKADPLGHDPNENRILQAEYQKILDLAPKVIKLASEKRKKQDELASLHERFTNACHTYQRLINSHNAFQHQNMPQGYHHMAYPYQ